MRKLWPLYYGIPAPREGVLCALDGHQPVLAPWGTRTEQYARCSCGLVAGEISITDYVTPLAEEEAEQLKAEIVAAQKR